MKRVITIKLNAQRQVTREASDDTLTVWLTSLPVDSKANTKPIQN